MPEEKTPTPLPDHPARAIILRIEEEGRSGGTLFRFSLRVPDHPAIHKETLLDRSRENYLREIYDELSGAAASRVGATQDQLQGIGVSLCRRLIPGAIAARL